METEVFRLEDIEVVKEGRPILYVKELVLREGEVLGLIGPNGAGKTTLLLVLGALEKPARGRIWFRGREVTREAERLALRRRLAVVFQEPLLLDTTVYDNVAAGLRFRRVPQALTRERVHRWLHRLGLDGLERRRARTLSGGEAQRVSLARALALEPEVLLLDEPFAALDSPTRSALLEDLQGILAATGLTAVFVTHDFRELPLLAHRVAAMMHGRVLQIGPPAQILNQPASLALASFVGVANCLPATIVGKEDGCYRLRAAGGFELWCRRGDHPERNGRVTACWRPEEVRLLAGPPTVPQKNVWPGLVRRVIPFGAQDKVVLAYEEQEISALVPHQLCRHLGIAGGTHVYFEVPPETVHLLPD